MLDSYTQRLWSDVSSPATAEELQSRRAARSALVGVEVDALGSAIKPDDAVDNEWPDSDIRIMRVGTLALVLLRSRESVLGPKRSV